jgi:hypothetical protein
VRNSIPNLVRAVDVAKRNYENEQYPLNKSIAHNLLRKQEERLAEAEAQLVHDKKVLDMAKNTTPFKKRDNKVIVILLCRYINIYF